MPLEMDAITTAFGLSPTSEAAGSPWTGRVGNSEVTAIHIGMGPARTRAAMIGLLLTFPATGGFAKAFPTWFPIVVVTPMTIALAVASALIAGIVAALFPSLRILRMKIVDGLRTIG